MDIIRFFQISFNWNLPKFPVTFYTGLSLTIRVISVSVNSQNGSQTSITKSDLSNRMTRFERGGGEEFLQKIVTKLETRTIICELKIKEQLRMHADFVRKSNCTPNPTRTAANDMVLFLHIETITKIIRTKTSKTRCVNDVSLQCQWHLVNTMLYRVIGG